jgi:cytidyltransferase-like protein
MFKTIFLGGTFDRLHKGHRASLVRAMGEGERVVLGITSDEFTKKYKKDPCRSHLERKADVIGWLKKTGFDGRVEIIAIDDPYEPAASGDYQAIIVTRDNRYRGEEINTKRTARNLPPAALVEVPIITADDGLPISSTRVRDGAIDEEGHLYMPDAIKARLKQPLGELLAPEKVAGILEEAKGKTVITVGDVATETIVQAGITPSLAIVDLHVRRKPLTNSNFRPARM